MGHATGSGVTAPRRAPAAFEMAAAGTALAPLEGASILVPFVVNVEHWSLDAPMPRAVLPPPHGMTVVPDVANHSWVLYGLGAAGLAAGTSLLIHAAFAPAENAKEISAGMVPIPGGAIATGVFHF